MLRKDFKLKEVKAWSKYLDLNKVPYIKGWIYNPNTRNWYYKGKIEKASELSFEKTGNFGIFLYVINELNFD